MVTPNRLHQAALTAVAVLLVTGCAADRGDHILPQALPARPSSQASTIILPLDPYMDSPRQRRLLATAHTILARACLRRFGLELPASIPAGAMPAEGNHDRYGLVVPRQAREHGYHLPEPLGGPSPAAPEQSGPQRAVLTGEGARAYAGRPVPSGGCVGEAQRALAGRVAAPTDAGLAQRLSVNSYGRSQRDPRVRAVFGAWSRCMRRAGFGYADPMQANDDPAFHTPRPSPREIAVATTDVRCKQAVGLVEVWAAVEAAYQRRALDRHAAQLRVLKRWLDTRLRNATRVTAQLGGDGGR